MAAKYKVIINPFTGEPQLVNGPATSGSYNVNEFTLTPTDIANKYVVLSSTPNIPGATILDVIGGITQEYGTDFTMIGGRLSWSGLALDGILATGDILIVQFT